MSTEVTGIILTSMTLKRRTVMNDYLWVEFYCVLGLINGVLLAAWPNWVSGMSVVLCVLLAAGTYIAIYIDKHDSNE